MRPLSYARAVSQPSAVLAFERVEDAPSAFHHAKRPTMFISVNADSYATSASAQHSLDKGDRALLALSTSGQINEYQILEVDENRKITYKHKLPYIEVLSIP
jgi:hypothetical protein